MSRFEGETAPEFEPATAELHEIHKPSSGFLSRLFRKKPKQNRRQNMPQQPEMEPEFENLSSTVYDLNSPSSAKGNSAKQKKTAATTANGLAATASGHESEVIHDDYWSPSHEAVHLQANCKRTQKKVAKAKIELKIEECNE